MNEIFHRTSIRKYTDQPVEQEKIELLMRAAMAAPSAEISSLGVLCGDRQGNAG